MAIGLGAGAMYPLLHGMEKRGWLKSTHRRIGGRGRRVYVANRTGLDALKSGRERVRKFGLVKLIIALVGPPALAQSIIIAAWPKALLLW
jgi:DNA-binding PadR family transcriptional regulator